MFLEHEQQMLKYLQILPVKTPTTSRSTEIVISRTQRTLVKKIKINVKLQTRTLRLL